MENYYESIGVRPVINASGRMTTLGVSTIDDQVAEVMKSAAQNYVVIDELLDKCGEIISKYTGGEDTCVTPNTSAAICLSCASVMTGTNRKLVEQLPDTTGMKNEFIIQKGHCVDYGMPIEQCIRISGGKPVAVGYANKCERWAVEGAINEHTAALIYVKSHHCVQKGMMDLQEYINLAHEHNLPIIMDCSAEEDIKKYIAMNADLVCYSGAKAICGPTSGMVTGKKELIAGCKLQYKGIGRVMKIGKENMSGLVKAVELYANMDEEKHAKENEAKVDLLMQLLSDVPNIEMHKDRDEAGRNICRLALKILPAANMSAKEVIHELEYGTPAIYTRDHYANLNIINFDPRPMIKGDEEKIAKRMHEILG